MLIKILLRIDLMINNDGLINILLILFI